MATPTLGVNVEVAAARSVGPTKSEQFGWGGVGVVAPELVLTPVFSLEVAAGALGLAAGDGTPPPGVAPTSDGLAGFVAFGPRLRPLSGFDRNDADGAFRASGFWAAAGLGVGLTRDVARPAVRVAIGYDVSTSSIAMGPFAGFFQLIEPDGGSVRPEDARLVMLGLHGAFGRGEAPVANPTARDAAERPRSCSGPDPDPGCPPPDRDRDGVSDARDGCVDVPEDRDGVDDLDGCPEDQPLADLDGDGISDALDACPDAPETVNQLDDEDGCPDHQDFHVEGDAIVFSEHFRFPSGGIVLDDTGLRIIAQLSDFLQGHPEYVRMRVQGHTDDIGPASFNLVLSRKRADEVIARLVSRGVDRRRLRADGQGENAPLDPRPTRDARRVNRRVQILIEERVELPASEETAP